MALYIIIVFTNHTSTWNFLLFNHFDVSDLAEKTSLISTKRDQLGKQKKHSHGTHGMQLIAVQIGMHLLV